VSTYPDVYGGKSITAQMLTDMQPVTVIAAADQVVTNSVTATNDNELLVTVLANASYLVEVYISASNTTASNPGFRSRFTYPAGASAQRTRFGSTGTAASYTSRTDTHIQAISSAADAFATYSMTGDSAQHVLLETGVFLIGPTAGSIQFQFAMRTAVAAQSVTRHAGSFIRVQRYA
jgi:hypothetical protein